MIQALTLRLANQLMVTSKVTHDFAVDATTTTVSFVYTNDVPEPIRSITLNALGHVLLWGDALGNLFVQLYVYLFL